MKYINLSPNFQFVTFCDSLQNVTLFRMGRNGAKDPPTSFFPVTSISIGISPKNFLTFSFDHFATLM